MIIVRGLTGLFWGSTAQFGGSNPQDGQQIAFLALAPIVALLLLEVVGKWVYRGYKRHGM